MNALVAQMERNFISAYGANKILHSIPYLLSKSKKQPNVKN
jgi:hypothetical protein